MQLNHFSVDMIKPFPDHQVGISPSRYMCFDLPPISQLNPSVHVSENNENDSNPELQEHLRHPSWDIQLTLVADGKIVLPHL